MVFGHGSVEGGGSYTAAPPRRLESLPGGVETGLRKQNFELELGFHFRLFCRYDDHFAFPHMVGLYFGLISYE